MFRFDPLMANKVFIITAKHRIFLFCR
jgi:hypothetical protein